MAFELEPVRTPNDIGAIVITLKDAFMTDESGSAVVPYQSASYQITVVLDDGSNTMRRGNLIPHITPAERQALMDFMDALRVRAAEQILGTSP